jgi:type IV fimbrial biogenesis protein FimT
MKRELEPIMTDVSKRGFTLIELLVTMAVAAILVTIAIPSYQTFVLNNRMSSKSNDLLGALQLARSEAIKRNSRVTVCKGAGGACAAGGTWAQGWMVFDDGGVAGTLDGTDQPIQIYPALTGATTVGATANVSDFISYLSTGMPNLAAGTTATLTLCPGVAGVNGRDIQIVAAGRASIVNAVCP